MENRIENFLRELVEIMEEEGVIERMLSTEWDYVNFTKESFIGALECLFGGEHDKRIEESLGYCNPYLMASYMAKLIVANELTACEPKLLLRAIVDKMAEFGVDVTEALKTKCRASLEEVVKLQKYDKRKAHTNDLADRMKIELELEKRKMRATKTWARRIKEAFKALFG